MKIGIFDSGLGGLVIAKSIMSELPQYDLVYLGDVARLPYGDKTERQIYQYTTRAVDFLCREGCALITFACNTASANALRKIQRVYLPRHYPNLRVLGVIIPTAEQAAKQNKVGVIGTASTIRSKAY